MGPYIYILFVSFVLYVFFNICNIKISWKWREQWRKLSDITGLSSTYPCTSKVITKVGSACRGIPKGVRIKKKKFKSKQFLTDQ